MSEHLEQCAVIQYCKIKKHLIFAIPNGTNVPSYKGRSKLKAEGLKSGVPDLMIPEARNGFHGFFIEMKKPKTGKVSANQDEWLDTLCYNGYRAEVCYGATEAIAAIDDYFKSI